MGKWLNESLNKEATFQEHLLELKIGSGLFLAVIGILLALSGFMLKGPIAVLIGLCIFGIGLKLFAEGRSSGRLDSAGDRSSPGM